MNNLKRYTLYIVSFIDILSIFLAYLLSFVIRFYFIDNVNILPNNNYRYFLLVVLVAYFIVNFTVLYKEGDFLNRNSLKELAAVMKISIILIILVVFYLNFAKMNAVFSRIFEVIYVLSFFFIDLILRLLIKSYLISDKYTVGSEKVLLISPFNFLNDSLKRIKESSDWRYLISGIIITDKKIEEKSLDGIKIAGNIRNMFSNEILNDYDSIIIIPGKQNDEKVLTWLNK